MRLAGAVVDPGLEAIDNHDDRAKLHEEIGRLAQAFRNPLILCYFDGLTQEQAAAQLRCPLGTIQSRLARGRAKLKARLEKRDAGFGVAFAGENLSKLQACPVPSAWADATVRLAVQYAHGDGLAIAGAGAAAVTLAEEIVRAAVMTKVSVAAVMIAFAFILVSGAAAWAMHGRKPHSPDVAANMVLQPAIAEPENVQDDPPPSVEFVTRRIRGTVRDQGGRPLAKAWIGRHVEMSDDHWEIIEPLESVRERSQPFRDVGGTIVPAGRLAKYFELRDPDGTWRPLHPRDVRRYDRQRKLPFSLPSLETMKAIKSGLEVFEVRTRTGRLEMAALEFLRPAARTDSQGRFLVEASLDTARATEIHFASADFSQEAVKVVRAADAETPIEVTLTTVRPVRAQVTVTPGNQAKEDIQWRVFTVDKTAGELDFLPIISAKGAFWDMGYLSAPEVNGDGAPSRQLEMRLPRGQYKIDFSSDTLDRIVDIDVPEGNRAFELSHINLQQSAWFKMLGKPAADIAADDLDGNPVSLADTRGNVTVLVLWSTKNESARQTIAYLVEVQKRFKVQPLAILALHDASLNSIADLKQALARVCKPDASEMPIRFLLDRTPITNAAGGFLRRSGKIRSGQTADIYERWSPTTAFVIDKNGRLDHAIGVGVVPNCSISIGRNGDIVRGYPAQMRTSPVSS